MKNGIKNGFHTHILCAVPRLVVKEFEDWSMNVLQRLTRDKGRCRTLYVVTSNASDARDGVARCWNWFRYLTKQLDEKVGWGPTHAPFKPMREVLGGGRIGRRCR